LGGYRSKLEILADMLRVVARARAKKTQIMYQANLSYGLLTKYLAQATEAYLIQFENKERRYALTSKGERFLQAYAKYTKSSRYIEKQLNNVNSKKQVLESLCAGGACEGEGEVGF